VRCILVSESYIGRTYYNHGQVVSGGRRKERPFVDWISVAIPAIITTERHAAAQAQLARNRTALVGRPARFTYSRRRFAADSGHSSASEPGSLRNSDAPRPKRSPRVSSTAATTPSSGGAFRFDED